MKKIILITGIVTLIVSCSIYETFVNLSRLQFKLGSVNKLSISHIVSETLGVGYNVGYDYFGTGKGDFTYSVALGISIFDKLGIYLESYGNVIEFDNHEANFDTGITYLIKDNFQLDVSFGTGINHTMNYVAAGMSINISKQKSQ